MYPASLFDRIFHHPHRYLYPMGKRQFLEQIDEKLIIEIVSTAMMNHGLYDGGTTLPMKEYKF
jgi:hypothetical protein